MSFGGGLQTTANVNIKVGVQRQASFTKFEQQLAAMKASLNQVSTGAGGKAGGRAQTPTQQAAAQLRLQTAQNNATASGIRLQQTQLRLQQRMGAPMDTAVRQFRQDQALAAQRHNANLAAARQMVQDRIRQNSALRNVAQTGYKGAMDDAVRNYKAVRAFAATQSKGAMDDAVRNFKRDQKIAADNHKKNLAAAKQMVAERLAVNERLATTATNKTLRDNMLRQMATSPAGVDAKRYQNAVVSMRNYVTAMDPAIQKTKDFIRMQNKLSKEIGAQREHSRRMAGDIGYRLDQTEKNLDAYFRAAFRLQMVGQRLINVGRSIQQFISGIMDTFGQFQYMLNRAGATLEVFTQKGEAGKIGLLDLQEGILQLSRSSMLLPAKDVAEAMYYWASATGQVIKTNEDLQNNLLALEPIMHVAVMTNTGYETAIKGVYSIISQFYNGAIDKATFVTEQLYYAAQKTAVEFEDLINSFKMVGPVARANNVTFEEMLNIFMQLGDVGIRGTMAGRALRQLFIQTAKPSKFAITEMKQMFGDDWFNKLNPGGHFVGALNYIKMIAKATLDWTEADRNHSIAQMTTANELPVVVALVGKYQRALLGLDTTMNKYVTTAEKARDYTKRGWETLQSSWIAVSGSLSRAWEHLQIQIGSTLADVLNPLVIKIRDIVEGIRLWAKANPDIVRALGQITALVGIIAAGSGIILTVIGSLLGIVTALVLVGKVVAPILAPVSAFIALIIGLGVAVIQNADYISARFREMSTIINATLKQNGQAVADFGNIFGEAAKLVSDILGIIVRTVADALPYIGRFIAMILDINKVIPILDALKVLLIAITANLIIRGLANLTMQFTGLNRVMRAFYVNNMLAYYGESTSRIGVLTMGVRGLAASFKGLLASLGPVGIAMAAISIAFAAYETNFGGFADFIDSITDKFRNLKDEVAALTADLGFFIGKDVERSIEKMISNLGGIKQSINAEGMVNLQVGSGKIYTVDPKDVKDRIDGAYGRFKVLMLKDMEISRQKLNEDLANLGSEPVDQVTFAKAMLNFQINPAMIPKAELNEFTPSAIVSTIIREAARTGYGPESEARIKALVLDIWKPGQYGGKVANYWLQDFHQGWVKTFGASGFIDDVIAKEQTRQLGLYDPLFKALDTTFQSAVRDENGQITDAKTVRIISDLLTQPFIDAAGKMHQSLSGDVINNANIDPAIRDMYTKYMTFISNAAEELTPEETATAIRDQWLEAFGAALTSVAGVREIITKAAAAGTSKSQFFKAINAVFSIKGKDAKTFFRGFLGTKNKPQLAKALEDSFNDISGLVDQLLERHPGMKPKTLMKFLRSQIPSWRELSHLGYTPHQIRTIRRNMSKALAPILDALKPNATIPGKPGGAPGDDAFTRNQPAPTQLSVAVDTAKTEVTTLVTDVNSAFADIPPAATSAVTDAVTGMTTETANSKGLVVNAAVALGQAWAQALRTGVLFGLGQTVDGVTGYLTSGNMVTFKSEHQKKVLITVDVKSSDGTANQLTQGQIREAAIRGLSVNSIEHLAQIG